MSEPREQEPRVDWFSAKRAIQHGISACFSIANQCEAAGHATSSPELLTSAENHRVSAGVLEAYVRQTDAAVHTASAPSLEKSARNEWRLDDLGLLDDVVVDDVKTFRMERMSPDHVWGAVYYRDGSRTDFNLHGTRLSWTHEPETRRERKEG